MARNFMRGISAISAFTRIIPTMGSEAIGEKIKAARKAQGLTQNDLAEVVGRNRKWVVELERGCRYDGSPLVLDPHSVIKVAAVLDLDAEALLVGLGVPYDKWPELSYTRSNSGSLSTIDLSGLSTTQAKLIQQLVSDLKAGNYAQKHSREQQQ